MVKVGRIQFTKEQSKRTFHLPIEQAVIVPSTSGVKSQRKVSSKVLSRRVNNVRRFLAGRFGGFTDVKKTGGFILRGGKLQKERVVRVTSFASRKAFKKNRPAVIRQIGIWGKKWKQESVGYEHEGDLFIIEPPKNRRKSMARRMRKK